MNDNVNEIEENKESNYITAEINISECDLNSKKKIIEGLFSSLKIDDEIKPEKYFYNFTNPGNHRIKYIFEESTLINGKFSGCSSLTKIDLTHFNTEDSQSMQDFFNCCSSLKIIDLSNVKTTKMKNMNGMFYNCKSLID